MPEPLLCHFVTSILYASESDIVKEKVLADLKIVDPPPASGERVILANKIKE